MADAPNFAKLVPGFEFMQNLMQNAGSAMPGIGQWVAPTLNPEEIDKRIDELRTVQFWLEQNARMLGATIQALEVQRMTLETLQTMNVQMEDLRESLTIRMPEAAPPASAPAPQPSAPAADAPVAAGASSKAPHGGPAGGDGSAAAPGVVDPMQWWGALTQQFTKLAADALQNSAEAVATPAGGPRPGKAAPAARSAPAAPAAAPRAAPAKRSAKTPRKRKPAGG